VASKFAVLGFSQSLRVELAPHRIGVTAICPGMINTAIIDGGRMSGAIHARKSRLAAVFQTSGASPALVARAILEAVRTNPAVRTVGRDAWALHALTRMAPGATNRIVKALERRFGAIG
jgi:short-subunit dehydrogenase